MLQKLRVALLAPKYIELHGTAGSLLPLGESATGAYSDPNESCPHPIYLESIVKVHKYYKSKNFKQSTASGFPD